MNFGHIEKVEVLCTLQQIFFCLPMDVISFWIDLAVAFISRLDTNVPKRNRNYFTVIPSSIA